MPEMWATEIGVLCEQRRWTRARLIFELRRAARSQGVTLPEDASLKRMIRSWNSGDRGLSELYAGLLAAVFGVPFTAGKPGDTGDLGDAGTEAGAAPALVPRPPGQAHPGDVGRRPVTAGDVEAVREFTRAFRRLDNGFGGGHAHTLAAQYLDSTVLPMLGGGGYTADIGRDLLGAAAQLAHLAAWTAYDIGDHPRARWYFTKALELAAGACDHAFGAEVLAARGHHAIHLGQTREAVELARASQQAARQAGPSRRCWPKRMRWRPTATRCSATQRPARPPCASLNTPLSTRRRQAPRSGWPTSTRGTWRPGSRTACGTWGTGRRPGVTRSGPPR